MITSSSASPRIDQALLTPGVSIVMSAYNEMRWLPSTIEAALAQSHTNFEFLIIDDASTDDSRRLLSQYQDPRLRIICHETRNGWLNNMNKLGALSRGRLIKMQCPDDVMRPECLKKAIEYFEQHLEVGYIFSDYYFVDENGKRISFRKVREFKASIPGPEADRISLFEGCFVNTSCLFIPRDKWTQMGGLRDVTRANPDRWPTVEDYDLMVRLQEFYPAGYVPEMLVEVRAHSQQVQGNPASKGLNVEASLFVYKMLAERLSRPQGQNADAASNQVILKVTRDHLNPALKDMLRGEWVGGMGAVRNIQQSVPLHKLVLPWLRTIALPAFSRRIQRLFGMSRRSG